jgi:hypothetical protein
VAEFVVTVVVLLLIFVGIPRALIRGGQRIIHPGNRVDRVRRFSMAEYREIMNRAGWQCEHHSILSGRCTRTEGLEADHVHPYSRGGATAMANSQALCVAHNKVKAAKVPFWWNLLLLQYRRKKYFSPSDDRRIVRYGRRSTTMRNRHQRSRRR